MSCYYFNLRSPNKPAPANDKAREFPDLGAAMVAAQRAARAMIRAQGRRPRIALTGCLDVEDERRQPVARIMLADIVRQIS